MKQTLFLLPLISCTILAQKLVHNPNPETQNLHRYMWANYNHSGGKLSEAQKWYDTIFATSNPSINNYKGYLSFLRDTNNYSKIIELIPTLDAHKTLKEDPAVQLIIIQALEKTDQKQNAVDRLIDANNLHKDHQELAFFTANLYVRRKEPKNALIVIDNFLKECTQRPNNFIFYFLKSQILVQLNQVDQAIKHLNQCLGMHPNFDKGWLFYSMLNEKQNNIDNAIKGYITYLELIGGNKEVERHLIQLVLKQNMLKEPQKSISIDPSALKQIVILFQQKRYQKGLEELQEHINKKIGQRKANIKHNTTFTINEYKKTLRCVQNKLDKMLKIDKLTIAPICHYPDINA